MSAEHPTLGQLAEELQIPVDDLAGIAWSLGIMASGPADRVAPSMAQAIREAAPNALRASVKAPVSDEPGEAAASGAAPPTATLAAGPSRRVFELADEYGVNQDVILDTLRRLGIVSASHLTLVSGGDLAMLRTHLAMNPPKAFAEERLTDAVRKRRRLRPKDGSS